MKKRATVFALLDSEHQLHVRGWRWAPPPVIRWLSMQCAFFLAGGLFLVSSLLLLRLEEPAREPSKERASEGVEAGAGRVRAPWTTCAARRGWRPVRLAVLLRLRAQPVPHLRPALRHELGAPSEAVGPLVAVSWLVSPSPSPSAGGCRTRSRRTGLILAGLAGMVVLSAGSARRLDSGAVRADGHGGGLGAAGGAGRPAPSLRAGGGGGGGPGLGARPLHGRARGCAALAQVLAPLTYGFVARRAGLSSAFLLSSGALLLSLAGMAWAPSASHRPLSPTPPSSPHPRSPDETVYLCLGRRAVRRVSAARPLPIRR